MGERQILLLVSSEVLTTMAHHQRGCHKCRTEKGAGKLVHTVYILAIDINTSIPG